MRLRILIIILFSFLAANASDDNLKVGIQQNYPPYEFSANNRIIGFNIDILHQLSDLFSFELEFVQADKRELKTLLDSGQIDFISFCFQSEENKRRYNLSIPYNMVTFGIYVPFESEIQQARDIMARKVSVHNHLIYEMMQSSKSFQGNLILQQKQINCLKDIIHNEADAAIISSLTGKYLIEKNNLNQIKIPPVSFKNLQYSFAFNKINDSLLVQFNEGLNILRETGTYNRIYQKWFGEVHPRQAAEVRNIVYWPYYILSAVIIILILLFINQRKRYLNLKTLKEKEIDIRHNAERSLYEHKKLIELMVDKFPHLIVVKNAQNQFVLVNQNFAELVGQKRENIINQNLNENALPDNNILHIIALPDNNQDINNYEIEIVDSESRRRTFKLSKTYIHKPDTDEKLYLIMGIDITYTKHYEEELTHEKALLSSLVNSIPDPIFYKNRELKYIGGNGAFRDLNGFVNNEEFIDKDDYELYDKSTAETYQESDKEILKTKKPVNFNRWEKGKGGKQILYDTLKVPIIDYDGNMTGIVGISRDITDQAEIQNQLKKAKTKAEESDKLKTNFLTNLSHEIRTPLNSIIGFSDLLTDPDLTDDQREEFTELISKSGASLLNLVDDIIDLSKIEAGQVQVNKAKFDLNRMLIDLHEAIEDSRDLVNRHAVSLEYYIPGNEEEAMYYINDEFRIRQILTNLIKNALKYTNKGEVKFGYRFSDHAITFFVKDTGLGIPEEQKDNIFERYNQTDTLEKFGGSGLGLSISKRLTELLGGEIDFTTDELKGSEFYFTFPLKDEEQTAQASPKTNLADEYNWSDIQILVAEDEQNNYMFIEEALRATGAEILWAKDGEKAVDAVKNNPGINLVLMDIKMPNMDGYEATKLIKNIREDLPIIAQTAYAMSDERDLSMQAGCDEYLTKPIRPKKLLRKINQLL